VARSLISKGVVGGGCEAGAGAGRSSLLPLRLAMVSV
jgi:hypothetical protein